MLLPAASIVAPGPGTVVGGAIGAVVGAVAGGLAGKGVADAINPTAEDEYWRGEYRNRPYYTPGTDYDRDKLLVYQRKLLESGYVVSVQADVDPEEGKPEAAPVRATEIADSLTFPTCFAHSTDTDSGPPSDRLLPIRF